MQRFRLQQPIRGIVVQQGEPLVRTLSAGSVVRLIPNHASINGIVDVVYKDELYSVVGHDLEKQAKTAHRKPARNAAFSLSVC